MDLDGKNILITGAAKRLGRELARAFAESGSNIAIHYNKSKEEALALAEEIFSMGRRAVTVKANIEKPKEITRAVSKAYEELGVLDVLINNAAIFYPTPVDEIKDKDWDHFLSVNLKAPFFFSREFAALQGGGLKKIINISDSYALSPAKDYIPYGVSKAGIITLTKGLAKAYAPKILVNSICPGPVLPPEGADEKAQQRAISNTLLKREGSGSDITKTAIFIAENDYITGQAIYVDGGRNI